MVEHQESGRTRLRKAMLRPSRSQAIVGVLLALVGYAGVTQIRATEEDSTYAGYREQDLIDVLNGLAGASQRTQAQIDRLNREREDLQTSSTRRQAAIERSRREVENLRVLAGLAPVTGTGIRVTLTEVDRAIPVSTFLDVIQELRSAGAEAIQVNGTVRLVAQSAFEEDAGGIDVDGTLVEPPYVIDAVGDSSALTAAMGFGYGPSEQVERDGGRLEVDELASIDIDTTARRREPRFAEPTP